MIQAFRPVRTVFHFLYAVFFVLFFSGNPASLLPVLLFLVAVSGFEYFFYADIDSAYRHRHPDFDKTSVFKISVLFAIFSVIGAFYFGYSLWYILLIAGAIAALCLVHSLHFVSDLLVSLVLPALLLVHSSSFIVLSPVYWFTFFWEISRRSLVQISHPYGVERYTLPGIVGPEAARGFVTVLLGLCCIWPLLMSRYFPGVSFLFFALSGLIFAASIYALMVSHMENTGKLVETGSAAFLLGLFASLI